jgi:hypothetical protein
MRRLGRALLTGLCLMQGVLTGRLQAQELRPTPPPPPPGAVAAIDSARAARGASLAVSLFIYGPGDEVFERFGHIALAVADARTGEDIAFNWGMFDFNQPNFLGRFLTGDTRYWMAGYPTFAFNASYQAQNRSIRQLQLNLTPVQRGALYDFVAWNAQEQNKYYRYDYYRDNCATRVRDALDWVLGGALHQGLAVPGAGRTWRGETARITASDVPVFAGIQLALGRHADEPLSRWDESFLPDYLADYLRDIRNGSAPLVVTDLPVFTAQREPLPPVAPKRVIGALAIGLVTATLIMGLAHLAAGGARRGAHAALTMIGSTIFLVGGILGTALLLAGTVTKHAPYMGSNLTVTLMHPLWLAAAILWPWRGRPDRKGRAALALSVVIAVVATVGAVVGLLPAMHQRSAVVMAVVLPITQALALAAWQMRDAVPRQVAR